MNHCQNRWLFWSLLSLLSLAVTPVSAQEAVTVQRRAIELPAITETELVALPLDSDVYQFVADDFHDFRVLDDENREHGYLVQRRMTVQQSKVRRSWTVARPDLRPSETDGLTIRFTLDKDAPVPEWLTIVTPLQNFEQSVQLFGEVNGREERLVQDLIFDYAQYMSVRRTEIKIPATTARSFRLVIGTLTSEQETLLIDLSRELQGDTEVRRHERFSIARRPFRIDRLDLGAERLEQRGQSAVEQPYNVRIEQSTEDSERRETVLELSSQREPLTQITLQTNSQNFSRAVRLEVETADGKGRQTVGQGTFSSIEVGSIDEQHLQLKFAATRHNRYWMVISNVDSPPLEITGVAAHGDVHDVYVLAEPGTQMRLEYGQADAERPSYDTAALAAALKSGESPLIAPLGPVAKVSAIVPVKRFELRDLWNNPLITVPCILALIGILGWVLYQAARRIDALPTEGDDSERS